MKALSVLAMVIAAFHYLQCATGAAHTPFPAWTNWVAMGLWIAFAVRMTIYYDAPRKT